MINTEVFIATSQPRAPKPTDPRFSVVENEPAMNAQDGIKRLIDASLGTVSIGNSAQYQYGNKYNGEGHANRFSNRTLVAHNSPISIFQNDTNTQLLIFLCVKSNSGVGFNRATSAQLLEDAEQAAQWHRLDAQESTPVR